MTAHANATRAQALEDAIRQAAQVAEGVRESYSAAESLETLLGAVDVLMERVRTAPRDAAPDMGGCAPLDPNAARIARAALKFAATFADANGPFACDGVTLDAAALREVRRQINAGVVRNCERRTERHAAPPLMCKRGAPEAHADDDADECPPPAGGADAALSNGDAA